MSPAHGKIRHALIDRIGVPGVKLALRARKGFEDTAPAAEQVANPGRRLLFFARTALRTRDAHLTDGTTGEAPADAGTASYYGWGPGPDATLERYGTWIGCVTDTPQGRRVYLYPERAIKVAQQLATPLGVPFPYDRAQLDTALKRSGLITPNPAGNGKGQRWTVRHQLPGNDLDDKEDRQRVWDLPAGEVLGDLPGDAGDTGPTIAPGMESADTEGEISTLQEQAAERIKTIAGHVLPGVRVKILEWDEDDPDAPPDRGVAWPVRKLRITYGETALLTKAENREAFRQHMGLQLFGDPSALRAEWTLSLARVVLGQRPKFAEKIPHHPAHGRPGPSGETVIPYATTEDGDVATLQLSGTDRPHTLLTGGTGRGLTAAARVTALEAARQGIDVRLCNPKRASVEGLRGWPNITVAWHPPEIIKLIDGTYDEMLARYADIEAGRALARDYRRVLLLVDGLPVIAMLVNDLWAAVKEPAQPRRHPALRKFDALTAMCLGARMNVVVTAHSAGSLLLPGALAENLGSKVALGGQSKASAIRMFGGAAADQGIPPCPPGEGVTQTPTGLTRIKVHWLPDPSDWDTLTAAERQLLQDMLPPGATWDGPPPPATGQVPA